MSTVRTSDTYNINSLFANNFTSVSTSSGGVTTNTPVSFPSTGSTINIVDETSIQTLSNKTLGSSNNVTANSLASGIKAPSYPITGTPLDGQILTYSETSSNIAWANPSGFTYTYHFQTVNGSPSTQSFNFGMPDITNNAGKYKASVAMLHVYLVANDTSTPTNNAAFAIYSAVYIPATGTGTSEVMGSNITDIVALYGSTSSAINPSTAYSITVTSSEFTITITAPTNTDTINWTLSIIVSYA